MEGGTEFDLKAIDVEDETKKTVSDKPQKNRFCIILFAYIVFVPLVGNLLFYDFVFEAENCNEMHVYFML